MTEETPFRFVNSILSNKEYIFNTDQDEKDYKPFLINRALSMHIDTLLHAEKIAKYRDIPNKWAYDYYFYSIRKIKRKFTKWPKKEKNEITELLMKYYQINRQHAEEYQAILSKEQIDKIKQDMEIGGF